MDPNLDPELALALRVSLEEERARQEEAAKAAEEASRQDQGEQQSTTSQDVTMTENVQSGTSETENRTADLMVCLHFLLVHLLHVIYLVMLAAVGFRCLSAFAIAHISFSNLMRPFSFHRN